MKNQVLAVTTSIGVLVLATPAGASCVDEVAELEQGMEHLDTSADRRASVDIGDGQKEITAEAEEAGVEPQENWFGSPPSLAEARDQIASARQMAQDGDEDGCMAHVEHARQIVDGLER